MKTPLYYEIKHVDNNKGIYIEHRTKKSITHWDLYIRYTRTEDGYFLWWMRPKVTVITRCTMTWWIDNLCRSIDRTYYKLQSCLLACKTSCKTKKLNYWFSDLHGYHCIYPHYQHLKSFLIYSIAPRILISTSLKSCIITSHHIYIVYGGYSRLSALSRLTM